MDDLTCDACSDTGFNICVKYEYCENLSSMWFKYPLNDHLLWRYEDFYNAVEKTDCCVIEPAELDRDPIDPEISDYFSSEEFGDTLSLNI